VVAGPDVVPWIDDAGIARTEPEMAVLSALAHGNDASGGLDVLMATLAAVEPLHEERAKLYLDLVYAALTRATRGALEALMDLKGYQYKSEFARRYVAQGKAEGLAEGEAKGLSEALLLLVTTRGLPVTDDERRTILACRDLARLERWLRVAVTARSASEILDEG
jgi:hypothetical protein